MTRNAGTIAFEVQLTEEFDRALERVADALKAEGFGILTRIDVDKTLKEKLDADFRPYAILGACNPALAHRALSADAEIGLMLPCNVTVETSPAGEGSTVRILDPQMMMVAGGFANNDELQAIAAEARERLIRVAEALH